MMMTLTSLSMPTQWHMPIRLLQKMHAESQRNINAENAKEES